MSVIRCREVYGIASVIGKDIMKIKRKKLTDRGKAPETSGKPGGKVKVLVVVQAVAMVA